MDDSSSSSPHRLAQSDAAAAAPTPKKRRNTPMLMNQPFSKKKQKLPRNLDSITARNRLPDVPTGGQRIKGQYKKREKKDKDGKGAAAAGGSGAGPSTSAGTGARKGKAAKAGAAGTAVGATPTDQSTMRADTAGSGAHAARGLGDDDDENEGRAISQPGEGADANGAAEGAEGGAEVKEDDDDEQEEEPEYTEYEWNQEASSRGRSKEELKALLDCFSEEQLQRYEVYRRSVLSRSTLVGTILNQQVTQTMAFVVAGFCKVYVGEMVEKAREVMDDWGETGPIRPEHLREAQRRYKKEELQRGQGVQVPNGYKRRMFCR
ncbi:transcription initiation factor TFIID subunit 11 [Mortierella sp. GBA43]|nr:transcription initiation factor TFIID subunit 11 [Mortierella sp. GBA43]